MSRELRGHEGSPVAKSCCFQIGSPSCHSCSSSWPACSSWWSAWWPRCDKGRGHEDLPRAHYRDKPMFAKLSSKIRNSNIWDSENLRSLNYLRSYFTSHLDVGKVSQPRLLRRSRWWAACGLDLCSICVRWGNKDRYKIHGGVIIRVLVLRFKCISKIQTDLKVQVCEAGQDWKIWLRRWRDLCSMRKHRRHKIHRAI